jgi:hypothetical protein
MVQGHQGILKMANTTTAALKNVLFGLLPHIAISSSTRAVVTGRLVIRIWEATDPLNVHQ